MVRRVAAALASPSGPAKANLKKASLIGHGQALKKEVSELRHRLIKANVILVMTPGCMLGGRSANTLAATSHSLKVVFWCALGFA